jgi:hypothetical protein
MGVYGLEQKTWSQQTCCHSITDSNITPEIDTTLQYECTSICRTLWQPHLLNCLHGMKNEYLMFSVWLHFRIWCYFNLSYKTFQQIQCTRLYQKVPRLILL